MIGGLWEWERVWELQPGCDGLKLERKGTQRRTIGVKYLYGEANAYLCRIVFAEYRVLQLLWTKRRFI